MNPVVENLNQAAVVWAGLVWAVVWQSTLLVGVFALVAIGMRRSSPGLRYWLWQIAAIKLLVMPLWGVSILLPATPRRDTDSVSEVRSPVESGANIGASPAERRRAADAGPTTDARRIPARMGLPWMGPLAWQVWLLLGWGLAVTGQVARILHQRVLLERLLHRAEPPGSELLTLVAELSGRIGLPQRPEVVLTASDGSPFVCGLRRPTLVLPESLARSLEPGALESVLLHELAHLKRHDLVWDWIPMIARVLYFFHPAAHYIVYRARLERELSCDQLAMVMTGQSAAGYAVKLIEIVSRVSTPHALRALLASARLDGGEP